VIECDADEIGPSLRFATATVNRAERGSQATFAAPAGDDPWKTTTSGAAAGAGARFDDEPPF
jgi:single-strand DNA-binding protein